MEFVTPEVEAAYLAHMAHGVEESGPLLPAAPEAIQWRPPQGWTTVDVPAGADGIDARFWARAIDPDSVGGPEV